MKYYWKDGTCFPVSADVANDTIEKLKATLGKDNVTAKELLDASRDPESPLHSCFEWDDTIAAEKYRVTQARYMLRSIVVKIDYPEKRETITVRACVNVAPINARTEGIYVSYKNAMNNSEYRERVLQRALYELRAFQKKYSDYEELATVMKAIDVFAESVK